MISFECFSLSIIIWDCALTSLFCCKLIRCNFFWTWFKCSTFFLIIKSYFYFWIMSFFWARFLILLTITKSFIFLACSSFIDGVASSNIFSGSTYLPNLSWLFSYYSNLSTLLCSSNSCKFFFSNVFADIFSCTNTCDF